jgi:hypothetical protein
MLGIMPAFQYHIELRENDQSIYFPLCYATLPEFHPLATSVLGGPRQSAKEMKQ